MRTPHVVPPADCLICRKPLTHHQIMRGFKSCSDKCRRERQSRYLLTLVAEQRAGTFKVYVPEPTP
jgi:predicted nucleic acid-binding Zn ribbon protein